MEYGFRNDILDPEPYYEASGQLARSGESAIPILLRHLGKGMLIADALGQIGGPTAIEALARELSSSDWHRVEAAARGLGLTKDPSAKPHLERAMGSTLAHTVAEVHQALAWAMNELYRSSEQSVRSAVDRSNIWQQIQSIKTDYEDSASGHKQREEAIHLWQAIVKELPALTVRVPGQNYPPSEAKARAWSCLGSTIYYLRNSGARVMNRSCPEACNCYEQALALEPGDDYWKNCIKNVS